MSIHRDPVTHFTPSSTNIMSQVEAAMAKFDAAREQAALRVEARRDLCIARGLAQAVRGRHYDAIQRGTM